MTAHATPQSAPKGTDSPRRAAHDPLDLSARILCTCGFWHDPEFYRAQGAQEVMRQAEAEAAPADGLREEARRAFKQAEYEFIRPALAASPSAGVDVKRLARAIKAVRRAEDKEAGRRVGYSHNYFDSQAAAIAAAYAHPTSGQGGEG